MASAAIPTAPTADRLARYLLGGEPVDHARALHARAAEVALTGPERAAVVAALMAALRATASELAALEGAPTP